MDTKPSALQYPLSEVKKIIKEWLYLKNDTVIDVMLAIQVANGLKTDPNWMLIIGPPSHAKTELLRSLDGHPKACFLSNLTPSTLVSGLRFKKGQKDPSLLLTLDGKTLVLKDFTSILSMRSESQQEILGQLREVYDGQYSKAFGTGKKIDWTGHVGLLGAVTPVYDKHYSVIGTLGDRFLLYRTGNVNGRKTGLQAQKIVGHEDQMRCEIRDAVHKFLDQFNDLSGMQFKKNEDINSLIVDLASFVAMGRLPVERDYRNQTVLYLPLAEGTPRLTKQFMQLGMGLALVHGKPGLDVEIYEVIKKVGRDLLPSQRLKILHHLWEEGITTTTWKKTKEIADDINLPTTTVKLILEDLMIVELLDRNIEDEDKEKSPYMWKLSDQAFDLIKSSEVFKVSEDVPF